MHMLAAHINGMPPDGEIETKVIIHDGRTWPGSGAVKLWEGKTDSNGEVHISLPKDLKNKHIHLWVMHDHFEHLSEEIPVTDLGLFHTVRLTISTLHDRVKPLAINPQEAYKLGQFKMRDLYRKARYRNYFIKFVFPIISVAAVFVGWFIAGIQGLAIGCVLSILSLLLGSYATGYEKGI